MSSISFIDWLCLEAIVFSLMRASCNNLVCLFQLTLQRKLSWRRRESVEKRRGRQLRRRDSRLCVTTWSTTSCRFDLDHHGPLTLCCCSSNTHTLPSFQYHKAFQGKNYFVSRTLPHTLNTTLARQSLSPQPTPHTLHNPVSQTPKASTHMQSHSCHPLTPPPSPPSAPHCPMSDPMLASCAVLEPHGHSMGQSCRCMASCIIMSLLV